MSRQQFDITSETDHLRQYLEAHPHRGKWQSGMLLLTCREFRTLGISKSILEHTHSTLWVKPWLDGPAAHLQHSSQVSRIWALRNWWTWLFDKGVVDDNVLACFWPVYGVLQVTDAPLVLTYNLQRPMAQFLNQRGPGPALSNKQIRFPLKHFNVFLNRHAALTEAKPVIDESLVVEWMVDLAKTRTMHSVAIAAGLITSLFDFFVETGRLRDNPLSIIWARYPRQNRARIVETVLGRSTTPLSPVAPKPRFVSPFAPHFEQFVALKRAMGRKYEKTEKDLQRFDRFIASRDNESPTALSQELVHDWLLAGEHLHPRSKKKRVGLIRQFALYLARIEPDTYVPPKTLGPTRIPTFRAHIYSIEEYRALLKAALELPSPRAALRPKTLYTLLLVLYSTGIRVGEAVRLRMSDVNPADRTLLIRETKFFKSRFVPFSDELANKLDSYIQARNDYAPTVCESPFFINSRRRAYAVQTIDNIFKLLLVAAGVPHVPTAQRPRVYDIRHTYACSRVLKWYREGADVTAKLPLLATYMGHVSVLSTQIYLNSTVEILREASCRFEGAFGSLMTVEEVKNEHQ